MLYAQESLGKSSLHGRAIGVGGMSSTGAELKETKSNQHWHQESISPAVSSKGSLQLTVIASPTISCLIACLDYHSNVIFEGQELLPVFPQLCSWLENIWQLTKSHGSILSCQGCYDGLISNLSCKRGAVPYVSSPVVRNAGEATGD